VARFGSVSLSSHIADPTSVLSRLLAVEFPDLGAWRADLRARVPRGRTPVSWPEGSRPPYSTIGHAIDSRLRLALTDTAMHCCLEAAFARNVTDAMLISGLSYPLPPDIEALVATGSGASLPIVAPPVDGVDPLSRTPRFCGPGLGRSGSCSVLLLVAGG
jgi:hypothetical protein